MVLICVLLIACNQIWICLFLSPCQFVIILHLYWSCTWSFWAEEIPKYNFIPSNIPKNIRNSYIIQRKQLCQPRRYILIRLCLTSKTSLKTKLTMEGDFNVRVIHFLSKLCACFNILLSFKTIIQHITCFLGPKNIYIILPLKDRKIAYSEFCVTSW